MLQTAEKVSSQMTLGLYFSTYGYPTSASAIPEETRNPKIAPFHLNAACWFDGK